MLEVQLSLFIVKKVEFQNSAGIWQLKKVLLVPGWGAQWLFVRLCLETRQTNDERCSDENQVWSEWERLRMIVSRPCRDLWQLANKGKNMKPKPKHAETSQNTHGAYGKQQTLPHTLDVWPSGNFRRRRWSVPVLCESCICVLRSLTMPMLVSPCASLQGSVHLWIHTDKWQPCPTAGVRGDPGWNARWRWPCFLTSLSSLDIELLLKNGF